MSKIDCNQEANIEMLKAALPGVKTSTELLAQSYKTLTESHTRSVEDVRLMRTALTEHLLSVRETTVRLDEQNKQIKVLFSKADALNGTIIPEIKKDIQKIWLDLLVLKGSIGDVSISGLDKRQALSENIIKGVTFIGGAFIIAIIGIGVAAVYGARV